MPEPDGLPVEFYRTFKEELAPHIIELLQYCYLEGAIPPSWKEARLVLIPKEGNDHRLPMAYRPLSMLNADYKILATILANGINTIIGICVHKDQTGFIRGRFLKSNVRKVLNIINKTQIENNQRVLLFLDAEKAFVQIEWQYMVGVVEKFNFGPSFLVWLQLLYQDQSAVISINGQTSEQINLECGVRHGCPLAPLLFALALEPLATIIRSQERIKGVCVGKEEAKIALYADGIMCFLEQPLQSNLELDQTIRQLGEMSGYKINRQIILGGFNMPKSLEQSISEIIPAGWSLEGIRYLGVRICVNQDQMIISNL